MRNVIARLFPADEEAGPPPAPAAAAEPASVKQPVGIIDIGSNSVRLVAYEARTRAPTPIFNEKVLCGLGRGLVTTGQLPEEGVDRALKALRRFRILGEFMQLADMQVVATAAAREAKNGTQFLAAAEEAIGTKIELLSGRREAELSALGVLSAIYRPDGVVGDLGGGSLELIKVKRSRIGKGASLPLGGLALMDASNRSPRQAAKIVREAIGDTKALKSLSGRTFYAVGGTWRALARLHMRQRNYRLNIMHNYTIPVRDAVDFLSLIERVDSDALVSIGAVSSARRPLLAYGAVVLEEIIRKTKPKEIVISVAGVREGLLYERLDKATRKEDALIAAARDFNVLRSREAEHGEELFAWVDVFMRSTGLNEETAEEVRLRHAACLLADIGWRGHPDYRGEQSLNMIANASIIGIDHPGRAFIALVIAFRYEGPEESLAPELRTLVSSRLLDRARILGAAMRVAYIVSAGTAGVLPRTPMLCGRGLVNLTLPPEFADLASDRLQNRLQRLARLIGRDSAIRTE
ncbi:MAG: exopolyphosphatase / guanosine-5-triphosphate,3-diphosphate pyrophosphatase [Methylobacteriaceae bacterium]|nr:exopolyphosphatase / guanosine-5-triphosphate,3-diphosphate pyrophosphatase [Methylobacteriaceae bacterium]